MQRFQDLDAEVCRITNCPYVPDLNVCITRSVNLCRKGTCRLVPCASHSLRIRKIPPIARSSLTPGKRLHEIITGLDDHLLCYWAKGNSSRIKSLVTVVCEGLESCFAALDVLNRLCEFGGAYHSNLILLLMFVKHAFLHSEILCYGRCHCSWIQS